MEKRIYLAYGSNLNMNQMRYRCPDAWPIGTAIIKDYQLLFKGSKSGAYLTIEPKVGSVVPVGVWQVSEEDEKNLDRYEGYPNFYYKKEIRLPVKGFTSKRPRYQKAFVYIMHEDRKLACPSKRYLRTCMDGYDDFGFDKELLVDAYFDSVGGDI